MVCSSCCCLWGATLPLCSCGNAVCREQSTLLYVYLQIPSVLFSSHMFFIQFPLSSLLFTSSSPKSWQSKGFQAELKNKARTQWRESNSLWQECSKYGCFSFKLCEGHMACTYASAVQGRRDFSAVLLDPNLSEETYWHDILERRTLRR